MKWNEIKWDGDNDDDDEEEDKDNDGWKQARERKSYLL